VGFGGTAYDQHEVFMNTRALSLLLGIAVGAGCSKQPVTHAAAENACRNRIELGYWEGFERSLAAKGVILDNAARATGQTGFGDIMSSPEGKAALAKCVDGYLKLATAAQVECVTDAETSLAAAACESKK
jgi:hypothetical protein